MPKSKKSQKKRKMGGIAGIREGNKKEKERPSSSSTAEGSQKLGQVEPAHRSQWGNGEKNRRMCSLSRKRLEARYSKR